MAVFCGHYSLNCEKKIKFDFLKKKLVRRRTETHHAVTEIFTDKFFKVNCHAVPPCVFKVINLFIYVVTIQVITYLVNR